MPFSKEQHARLVTAAIAEAKTIALQENATLLFDPQGRILVDVGFEPDSGDEYNLSGEIKSEGTQAITVSLDIHDIPGLLDKWKKKLTEALQKQQIGDEACNNIIGQLYPGNTQQEKIATGSIISLQQEYHFHLSLACRTWEKVLPSSVDKNKLKDALKQTMSEVNTLVLGAYAQALVKANVSGTIDRKVLNKELDVARKSIVKKAHEILFKNILKETQITLDSDALKKLRETSQKDLKKIAEGTTATPNAIIHTSSSQGLATWISGSENTAHHRAQGFKELPQRQMITYPYRNNEATADNSLFDRLQTRTASLDVKKGVTKKNRPAFITDIADKLQGIGAKYGYLRPMDFFGAEQKAFIYNLHTASNDKIGPFAVGDMNGNKQTQGAELILQGAHEYNARQLVGRTQPLFCFVQNISVNGFGDTMGYRGSRLSREATLMTEMAMMHTLRSTCTEDQQVDINQAMLLYVNYLGKDPREAYFSDSTEGKAAIQWMSIIKEQWTDPQSSNNTNISMSLMDCAKEHLKKIIGNNLHFSHQYAVLIQSLSVFVEKASIAGCKSGNERAQMINGRVGIFDQVLYSSDTADPAITDLKEALRNTDTDQLKKAMNDAYEKHGAQQAASMISEVDQGGPSKVNQRPKQGSINRNNVEEISMSQKYSDSLQAHKGMTKAMVFGARKAIATHQRDLLKNEKEQEFKKTTLKGDSKARKAFQEHLKSAEVLLKSKMSEVKRNQFIKEGKPEKAAINMKSLLGAKGVQLYKEALKEEREQEKASFEDNATDETLGEDHPFKKRFVAQILGPAGVGKTGAVRDLLPMLSAFMEKDTSLKKVKPTVLKIDGGDSRDHSKVRQWALQHAISKGYTGVKDIYSIGDEKILGKVKGEIEKRAAADSKCNMIIPTTTFKSNMVKKCNAPENVQEVFVHVMGEREVVAYQQNSRAWKKNWDNKALPESKAPPSSQAISFTSGEHQATLAMNAAQKKGALTFIVINDCILVKKINGEWKQTTDTTGEVRQVSKRAMEQWEQRDKKSDANVDLPEFLKNNNLERLPSIITTPEQLKVDATIKHLEKMSRKTTKNAGKENTETENTENDSNTLSEIVSLTKELQTLWEGKQWQEYQQRVYAVKYNITSACTHTTSHAIRTSLKQLESQLNEAQKRVPKMASLMNTVELTAPAQEGMPTPPVSPRGAAPSAGRDEAVDKVVFTREIVIRDPSVSKTSAQSPSGVSVGAKQVITQKEEVIHLEKNQYIQVSADFGGDQRGVLHQNSQGTVDDFSPDNLKPENEARLALEQAKLFLLHRKPGSGNIIMSGTNSTRANRVHAALLLLKNCDSSLEDIKIQSRVAHNASQAEPKDDEFLDKHLRNVIPSEVIERVKAEIRASIESKKSQAPVTPHSSQESLKVRLQQGRPNGDDSEATLVHKSPGVAPT